MPTFRLSVSAIRDAEGGNRQRLLDNDKVVLDSLLVQAAGADPPDYFAIEAATAARRA